MAMPVGVGIIADRKTTGAALAAIIESDSELLLIGTAGADEGPELLKNGALRVLLVNLSLSSNHDTPATGVQFIGMAKAMRPEVGVVSLKRRVDENQLRAALDAGADACCLATTPSERLRKAIKVVADGATWLDAEVAHALFHRGPRTPPVTDVSVLPHLSPREEDILRLIVEGYSNDEIAISLRRSNPTVRTHLAHLYKKLGVNDRVSAAVTALRHGLV
jgi:DNA-binding NarL/FixJ family response regulator